MSQHTVAQLAANELATLYCEEASVAMIAFLRLTWQKFTTHSGGRRNSHSFLPF